MRAQTRRAPVRPDRGAGLGVPEPTAPELAEWLHQQAAGVKESSVTPDRTNAE
jgi:hypothetical protein